jgi:xylan 1,4-beta-xylosidase
MHHVISAIRTIALAASILPPVLCGSVAAAQGAASLPSRLISIDCDRSAGPMDDSFKMCVGAGRANEGLRADWQRQLTYAKQQCDFQYIRMHGLLTDDMGVYQEDRQGQPVYNWQYIDDLYDFLESIHVRPFVELGFMPNALASGTQTIFWWRGNVTPPKDYGKWHDLIQALVRHWTERYGHDEVKNWYFEVWNEPNLGGFWTGSEQDYFKLYSTTADAVKSVSKDYRVGGPATAGNGWIADFISYCVASRSPVDFISTHTYGVDAGFLDENGSRGTVLSHDPESINGDMIRARHEIDTSGLPKLPLHYTEWSASYTPADPIHDSYVEAPFILEKIKHASGVVSSMSYWTFTDIFEEAGPRMTPFHGGFGLINYEDIDKPAFFAFQFLNRLGATRLADSDDESIVTNDNRGDIAALFWDYSITQPTSVNDQVFYKEDLPTSLKERVVLNLGHVAPGKYTLTVYRIGYRINDPYDTYRDLGSPSQLTRAQVATIKADNSGSPYSVETVRVGKGQQLTRTYPVRTNDVYLVCCRKN